jgi:hypothetical protein
MKSISMPGFCAEAALSAPLHKHIIVGRQGIEKASQVEPQVIPGPLDFLACCAACFDRAPQQHRWACPIFCAPLAL